MARTATRNSLSLEDLAVIAAAPPTATPAELARRLGLPREPVGWRLRRFRRAGGWHCELKLPPCTECGEPVIGPPRRIMHVACVPARKARWVREKRRRVNATAAPEALEARRERERAGESPFRRAPGGAPGGADRKVARHRPARLRDHLRWPISAARAGPWTAIATSWPSWNSVV
jgi:hypothetical protein